MRFTSECLRLNTIGVVVVILGIASSAAAQDSPNVVLSAGYQWSSYSFEPDSPFDNDSRETFPAGWYADVSAPLSPWLSLVWQVHGSYNTEYDADSGQQVDADVHAFLGGVRASLGSGRIVPFAQLLIGGARLHASSHWDDAPEWDESASLTALAIQYGGGVDWNLTRRFGVRVGADFGRMNFGEIGDVNTARLVTGAVVRVGR